MRNNTLFCKPQKSQIEPISPDKMADTSFPLISFQKFITGLEVEKRAVAQELYNAFHTFGWIYLKDFGISTDEIDEMFVMVSKSKFFDSCQRD
jgi:isopenicillin N synthase-like dioxygenase